MSNLRSQIIRLASTFEVGSEQRRALLDVLREDARTAAEKKALRVRQFQKLLSKGRQFGILSAYGPGSKKQNQLRHGELFADLQRAGYRPVPLKGSWEGITEKSVLVPEMEFRDLVRLGKKYNQDAVIYKDPTGTIGMYYQKEGVAEVAVEPDGDLAAAIAADPSLYSKARGISFEFGFLWGQKVPWGGSTPFTKADVEGMVKSQTLRVQASTGS